MGTKLDILLRLVVVAVFLYLLMHLPGAFAQPCPGCILMASVGGIYAINNPTFNFTQLQAYLSFAALQLAYLAESIDIPYQIAEIWLFWGKEMARNLFYCAANVTACAIADGNALIESICESHVGQACWDGFNATLPPGRLPTGACFQTGPADTIDGSCAEVASFECLSYGPGWEYLGDYTTCDEDAIAACCYYSPDGSYYYSDVGNVADCLNSTTHIIYFTSVVPIDQECPSEAFSEPVIGACYTQQIDFNPGSYGCNMADICQEGTTQGACENGVWLGPGTSCQDPRLQGTCCGMFNAGSDLGNCVWSQPAQCQTLNKNANTSHAYPQWFALATCNTASDNVTTIPGYVCDTSCSAADVYGPDALGSCIRDWSTVACEQEELCTDNISEDDCRDLAGVWIAHDAQPGFNCSDIMSSDLGYVGYCCADNETSVFQSPAYCFVNGYYWGGVYDFDSLCSAVFSQCESLPAVYGICYVDLAAAGGDTPANYQFCALTPNGVSPNGTFFAYPNMTEDDCATLNAATSGYYGGNLVWTPGNDLGALMALYADQGATCCNGTAVVTSVQESFSDCYLSLANPQPYGLVKSGPTSAYPPTGTCSITYASPCALAPPATGACSQTGPTSIVRLDNGTVYQTIYSCNPVYTGMYAVVETTKARAASTACIGASTQQQCASAQAYYLMPPGEVIPWHNPVWTSGQSTGACLAAASQAGTCCNGTAQVGTGVTLQTCLGTSPIPSGSLFWLSSDDSTGNTPLLNCALNYPKIKPFCVLASEGRRDLLSDLVWWDARLH